MVPLIAHLNSTVFSVLQYVYVMTFSLIVNTPLLYIRLGGDEELRLNVNRSNIVLVLILVYR